jgi:hypothetical protein
LASENMAHSSDYRKAYDSAKQELADLLATQQEIEKRIIVVRKYLQTSAALCGNDADGIAPSPEASYLLEHAGLADEIRAILNSVHPGYLRPHQIKGDLEALGHNLTKYQNPQATIQMILKRMTESGEVQEGIVPGEGKKTYRLSRPENKPSRMAEAFRRSRGRFDSERFNPK